MMRKKNNAGQRVATMSFHLKDDLGRKANMDAAGSLPVISEVQLMRNDFGEEQAR